MNDEHVLKGAFEGIKFGPYKDGQFSAASTVDLTMACMHFDSGKQTAHVTTHSYCHCCTGA